MLAKTIRYPFNLRQNWTPHKNVCHMSWDVGVLECNIKFSFGETGEQLKNRKVHLFPWLDFDKHLNEWPQGVQ